MALGTPGRRIRTLPPGQRAIDYFPRFGTGLDKPSPAPAADPVIDVAVGGDAVARVAVSDLLAMRRTTVRADFHCVAGWTATDLRWEGVRFSDFLDAVVSAGHPYRRSTSHAQFAGSDGFTSVACLKDVLAEDVLIADHLDGDPLPLDHGAPVRLVSPHQYGYISTKHLCAIRLLDAPPESAAGLVDRLLRDHPRARVALEERHGSMPGWFVRPFYRALKRPLLRACARGSERPGH